MTDQSDGDGRGDTTDDHALDVPLRGVEVDPETRCRHYRTDRDVVAIALPCCETFYPCIECHEVLADHETSRWPQARFDERAVLCGRCGARLSITAYLDCDHRCPECDGAFNPGCQHHWDRYFAVE
ncbi:MULTISPECIES: CHY zinc finger protein [Halococcus]|uniref:CHY-type domain-containing protein n=1 Tax=Halococcus salifodinae DSM 8989 TaxID=1227456 RepID=M0NDA3_9EURY|nr:MULTISPECIES: CHY zinc finger protein [Halococcus]EMA55518.1 hypothetical protein C450_02089 [Halococcus salifodinae DSM 8989]